MAHGKTLKLATFNVNGIGTRLPHLLAWLEKEQPDIVALQELKAADAAFPAAELDAAGYGAIWQGQRSWNGVALLARGSVPVESRRGLPGDARDEQSRYTEAAIHGIIVACLYLPNGNPQPGPKFDYKLAWMERLIRHARTLVDLRIAASVNGMGASARGLGGMPPRLPPHAPGLQRPIPTQAERHGAKKRPEPLI